MKKRSFYLLIFAGFIFLSFQFSQRKEIKNSDKEKKLRELISKTKLLELPIFLDVYQEDKSAKLIGLNKLLGMNMELMDNDYDFTPVLGILPDTINHFTFLAYKIGDIQYPNLISFDKKGNLIEEKSILLNDNFNVFEEVELSYQKSTINLSKRDRRTEITLLEITKGKRYREFESNTENTNLIDSLFCQKIIQTGFLTENGKVIFDDKIIEDCR